MYDRIAIVRLFGRIFGRNGLPDPNWVAWWAVGRQARVIHGQNYLYTSAYVFDSEGQLGLVPTNADGEANLRDNDRVLFIRTAIPLTIAYRSNVDLAEHRNDHRFTNPLPLRSDSEREIGCRIQLQLEFTNEDATHLRVAQQLYTYMGRRNSISKVRLQVELARELAGLIRQTFDNYLREGGGGAELLHGYNNQDAITQILRERHFNLDSETLSSRCLRLQNVAPEPFEDAVDPRKTWQKLWKVIRRFNTPKNWALNLVSYFAFFGVIAAVIGIPILAAVSDPVLTINNHANGTVTVQGCESVNECPVGPGAIIEVAAAEGYKLADLNPICRGECPPELDFLGAEIPIDIMSDVTITPEFERVGTLSVDRSASDRGAATCETEGRDENPSAACEEIAGRVITVRAPPILPPEIEPDDESVDVYERLDCSAPSWCGGLDLTKPDVRIVVPEALGTLKVTPVYRTDRLARLFIQPSSPRVATTAIVSEDDCLAADCTAWEGQINNQYSFQVRNGEPAPEVILEPPIPSDSSYKFARWVCEPACPGADEERLTLTLTSDVTVRAEYAQQVQVIINNAVTGNIDFGVPGTLLPPECKREDPDGDGKLDTIRCKFDRGSLVQFTIFPILSKPDSAFLGWVCDGGGIVCPSDGMLPEGVSRSLRFSDTLNEDITIFPEFGGVFTTELTVNSAPNGSARADCEPRCEKVEGWTTRVTATANAGYRFVGWTACDVVEVDLVDDCPNSRSLTDNPLMLTLDANITLWPMFELAPTVALTIRVGQGGYIDRAGDETGDCDEPTCTYTFDQGSEIRVDADPNVGYEAGQWIRINGDMFALHDGDEFDIDITLTQDTELEVTFKERPRIAFESNRDGDFEIYTMNAATGGGIIKLTDNTGDDRDPEWSPDGTRIVFISDRDGDGDPDTIEDFEIYTMNADGSDVSRLTDNNTYDNLPSWSPDGTRIVFNTQRDGNVEIYTMNADGSDPFRLTDHPARDWGPSWSPDGTRIVFFSDRDGDDDPDTNDFEIYTMNADDGGDRRRLTNTTGVNNSHPNWSPDGNNIAFASDRAGNSEIYVMRADGNNVVRVTNNTGSDHEPSWSSDGTRITFESYRSGNDEIYTINADGSGALMRLTEDPASDGRPSWSRKAVESVTSRSRNSASELIAFRSGDSIYTVNPDDPSTVNEIVQGERPAWSPDRTRIVFQSGGVKLVNVEEDNPEPLSIGSSGFDPTWSPDGTQIAFSRGDATIFISNADGSNASPDTVSVQDSRIYKLHWSPDRAKFVYQDRIDNGHLCVVDISGENRRCTSATGKNEPEWSPDGSRIAYEENNAIYVVNADTLSSPTNLVSGRFPTWAPDGNRIAFTSTTGVTNRQLFVMDADGANVIQITNDDQFSSGVYLPSWNR